MLVDNQSSFPFGIPSEEANVMTVSEHQPANNPGGMVLI